METGDALLLALAITGLIWLCMGKRVRKELFGAVLTRGKKGAFGLSLTPVPRTKKRRRKKR